MARAKVTGGWLAEFKRGTELDSWGQVVEAMECYQGLSRKLNREIEGGTMFGDDDKKTLHKMVACLKLRAKDLDDAVSGSNAMPLDELKGLLGVFKELAAGTVGEFPIQMSRVKTYAALGSSGAAAGSSSNLRVSERRGRSQSLDQSGSSIPDVDESEPEDEVAEDVSAKRTTNTGSLLPMPAVEGTILSIVIQQIGMKDAGQFIEPFFSVSIRDKGGNSLSAIQDTPIGKLKGNDHIKFGCEVHLQKPLEALPQDSAIFFEFKHYKPKKEKVSTRGFCFIEQDEMVNGPAALEIYSKPTDFRRRKLKLLSAKQLYMHVTLKIQDE